MKKIKTQKLPPSFYFENLDALRFLAFLFVFLQHTFSLYYFKTSNFYGNEFIDRCLLNGNLGVNFFFVLSGFLITWLLLREKEYTGGINFGSFYLRRALRIWPLYFLVLIICFYILPNVTGYIGSAKMNKGLYYFFLGNFDLVKNGVSNFLVSVMWSVSIEEQFYLFWPLFMSMVPVKHLAKFLLLVVIISIGYRLFGHSGKDLNLMLSYHTLSCIYNLAIGGIIAYLATIESVMMKFKNTGRLVIIIVYLVGFTLIIMQKDILKMTLLDSRTITAVLPLFYALFFAFVIVEQVYSEHSLFKVGKIPFLNKLGKISYGLYCYHMIIIYIVGYIFTVFLYFDTRNPTGALFASETIISFALSVLVAALSYRFIEKKFLQYKATLSPVA